MFEKEEGDSRKKKMLLEPRLVELLNQAHNAIKVRKDLALATRATLAVDLEFEIDFALRCVYLLHPGKAIRGLFHREHFLRILLHAAIAFPELEGDAGAVLLNVGTEVGGVVLSQGRFQRREMLAVANGSGAMNHDGTSLVVDGSSQTAAESPADLPRCQKFKG